MTLLSHDVAVPDPGRESSIGETRTRRSRRPRHRRRRRRPLARAPRRRRGTWDRGCSRGVAATATRPRRRPGRLPIRSAPTYRFSPKRACAYPDRRTGAATSDPQGVCEIWRQETTPCPFNAAACCSECDCERRALPFLRARPVDETRDRASLSAGRGRGVGRSGAGVRPGQGRHTTPAPPRPPCSTSTNVQSDDREKDGHAKADRRCRSRRDQALGRSLNSVILPLTRVTRCDPNRSPG